VIRTRRAVASDAQWLVESSALYAHETGNERLLPADPNLCGILWLEAIRDHVVLIAESGPAPVGFILAWQAPHPFNPALRTLTCGLWYVRPKWRSGRAGLALLNAFTEYADSFADVAYFTLQRASGDASLLRRGFIPTERDFTRWTHR